MTRPVTTSAIHRVGRRDMLDPSSHLKPCLPIPPPLGTASADGRFLSDMIHDASTAECITVGIRLCSCPAARPLAVILRPFLPISATPGDMHFTRKHPAPSTQHSAPSSSVKTEPPPLTRASFPVRTDSSARVQRLLAPSKFPASRRRPHVCPPSNHSNPSHPSY
jgi:hypothetical protein